MRLSSVFVFLGLVAASALAYPLYEESSSLYTRSFDDNTAEDLALRELYGLEELEARFLNYQPERRVAPRASDFDGLDAREYEDFDDLYAREYANLDDLDAREYDDLEELEARHEGHHGGPSITIHLRDDEMEEFDELFARFGYEDEMEDMEARELGDYEELDAREPHFHPRIGIVIPSSD